MKPIPTLSFSTTLKFMKKHMEFLPAWNEDLRQTYGDIVCYRRGFTKYYCVTRPEYAQQVLRGDYKSATKPPTYDILKPHLGDGLVSNEGETWVRQRRLSAPFFMKAQLDKAIPIIQSEIDRTMAIWSSRADRNESFNLTDDINRLTFKVLCRVILGENLEKYLEPLYVEILKLVEFIPKKLFTIFVTPFWLPTPLNIKFMRSARTYRKIIGELLVNADPQASSTGMISHLIKQKGKYDKDTIDIVATMLSAGFETTANGLSWILGLLATHPEQQTRLRNEIHGVLGDSHLRADNLFSVPYAEWVIDEALRMYPPILFPARKMKNGIKLDDYEIPKNGIAELGLWQLHRHPEYWENPSKFDPERFSPDRFTEKNEKAFMPFTVGPRECIGKNLALYELQMMLTTIVRNFELVPIENFVLKPKAQALLRPDNGVWVTLKRIQRKIEAKAPSKTQDHTI